MHLRELRSLFPNKYGSVFPMSAPSRAIQGSILPSWRHSKNFPRILNAHISHLPKRKPIDIWFQNKPGLARRTASSGNGPSAAHGHANRLTKATRIPGCRGDLARMRQGCRPDLPAIPCPRTEFGREYLAVSSREQAVEHRLQWHWSRDRRHLLRLEQPCRTPGHYPLHQTQETGTYKSKAITVGIILIIRRFSFQCDALMAADCSVISGLSVVRDTYCHKVKRLSYYNQILRKCTFRQTTFQNSKMSVGH